MAVPVAIHIKAIFSQRQKKNVTYAMLLTLPLYVWTICDFSFTSSDRRLSDFTVYLNTLSINGGEADSVTRKVSSFVLHENFDDKTNVSVCEQNFIS